MLPQLQEGAATRAYLTGGAGAHSRCSTPLETASPTSSVSTVLVMASWTRLPSTRPVTAALIMSAPQAQTRTPSISSTPRCAWIELSQMACLCSCTWLTTLLTRQGDGLVDAVTLSARGGGPRVHDAQVAVVQSSTRPSLVPQTQPEIPLLGIDDAASVPRDAAPPFSPLSSPLCSARSSRSALSEGGALALARSRDALRRASCQQVSDTAAQAAPSLSQSTAAELGGAALGATDGRHCSRCEEVTLVASSFGGLCYYCHSFPHAETWRQLRARFVLLAAFRASPSSSEHLPRASSMFDLPGLELQV